MKIIPNKKTGLCLLTGMLILLIPMETKVVSAATPRQTTVTYQVDPAYEIEIPTNITIPYQAEQYDFGKIVVKEALLEEDKCIQVTMDCNGVLENLDHPGKTIPYQILQDNQPFTGQTYTKTGEETMLTITIGEKDWKRAVAGTYSTSITFKVSYVDKK